MYSYSRWLSVLALLLTGNLQTTHAFGWNWIWPFTTTTAATTQSTVTSSDSVASNYAISIGNRENTNTSLTDNGTQISNLQINLARFNGTAIGSKSAVQDSLSKFINSVTEEYRAQSEAVVIKRLAWIDQTIGQAHRYATELNEIQNKGLLQAFAKDVRTSVQELNQTVRDCLEREVKVEDMIQSVVNRSNEGCIETRIQQLYALRDAARSNLTNFLHAAEDVEDLLAPCLDVQDYQDDVEMSNLNKVACVSAILLRTQTKTYRLAFTVDQLTTTADPILGQARASLLQCAADLAMYAFEVSLGLRQWINICSN